MGPARRRAPKCSKSDLNSVRHSGDTCEITPVAVSRPGPHRNARICNAAATCLRLLSTECRTGLVFQRQAESPDASLGINGITDAPRLRRLDDDTESVAGLADYFPRVAFVPGMMKETVRNEVRGIDVP